MIFNLLATSVRDSSYDDGEMSYRVDPLSFSVTKALVAYLVYYKGFNFWGLLGEHAVNYVGLSVGRELQLIGAGVGGVAALWEGILKR